MQKNAKFCLTKINHEILTHRLGKRFSFLEGDFLSSIAIISQENIIQKCWE